MAGTYVASLSLFSSGSTIGSGVGNNAVHFLQDPFTTGCASNASLTFILRGNCISLDGNALISFAGLPVGFTIQTANLRQKGTGVSSPGFVERGSTQDAASIITTFGSFYGPVTVNAQTVALQYPISTNILPAPTPIQLLSLLKFALSLTPVHLPYDASLQAYVYDNIEIYGNYSIAVSSFQSIIQNQAIPVSVGDKIKITSLNGMLDGVKQVQLSFIDPVKGLQTIVINNFITPEEYNLNPLLIQQFSWSGFILQQPNLLWFYLPPGFSGFTTRSLIVTLIGNGVQFSGAVLAGFLDILTPDVSGIYTIVKGQTNDVIYLRSGYTTDSKLLMLNNIMNLDDEAFEDDFYSMLGYPQAILSQNYLDTEFDIETEDSYFSEIAIPRITFTPTNVEIPSPFIKTAFLP